MIIKLKNRQDAQHYLPEKNPVTCRFNSPPSSNWPKRLGL
jgi:hypothetical protein